MVGLLRQVWRVRSFALGRGPAAGRCHSLWCGCSFDLLGFKNEVAAFVAVHAAVTLAAVTVCFFERTLKHVVLVGGGVWFVDA